MIPRIQCRTWLGHFLEPKEVQIYDNESPELFLLMNEIILGRQPRSELGHFLRYHPALQAVLQKISDNQEKRNL